MEDDKDETMLSLVFGGVNETKTADGNSSVNDEHQQHDEDSSLHSIESAIKQVLKCRETSEGTDSTANSSSWSSSTRRTRVRDHDRLQASFDHRGGPDFKAQADSRSIVADLAVRAQPVHTSTAPADYYGRVSQRRGRCIVTDGHDDMMDPIDLVTAVEYAPAQQVARASKPRKHRASRQHQNQKKRTLADERRFWLSILLLGLFLNFLLVSGATVLGLYLSGNIPGMEHAPYPSTQEPITSSPTSAPTPISTGRNSLPPTPFDPESGPPGRLDSNATDAEIATNDPPGFEPGMAPTPAFFAPTPELPPAPSSIPTSEYVPPADVPKNEAMSPLWVSGLVVGSLIVEACIIFGLTLIYRQWKAKGVKSEANDGEVPPESPNHLLNDAF